MINRRDINKYFGSLNISKETDKTRGLSYLSAIIAVGSQELLIATLATMKENNIESKAVYETILQSYLFLGFPRMIEASLAFGETYNLSTEQYESEFRPVSEQESARWFDDGIKLCEQVYGKNYERLKTRFESISPEMFRWMVIEGYGKVLSRPGLNSIERELAEVAALIVDKRERQLVSHIIGSLNVGASIDLIRQVNSDIKQLAGPEAFELAEQLISKVESANDSSR